MSLSAPFIRRPVGTVLLSLGLAIAGIAALMVLPIAPLPQVDYPTINVSASLAGASPETMATSIATPLERRLGIIPGVTEMTSTSSTGSTRITLQFELDRDIDGAAREVQGAINAARVDLPATLRSNPTYRKSNPAGSPAMVLALTSPNRNLAEIYEFVSNVVTQRIAQVEGVGEVDIGGGSLPAVRIQLDPFSVNKYGVALEDVRAALQAANAHRPRGALEGDGRRYQIYTTGSGGRRAADYHDLIVAWRDGAPIRLADIATVVDSMEDTRAIGLFNGQPAIIVLIRLQANANVIQTVDTVRAILPEVEASLPSDVSIQVASDRTNSIRASLHEIELTLVIAIVLVVLVVGAFLRDLRATMIPAIATVLSLLGTFGVMYLLGFSLNNLSLMAITIATGFVVDDAVIVLENTTRHIEAGRDRLSAALAGAAEVSFTVLSMSVSLVAVFIPLLFMGGQVGRLFHEFAVTLSVAVLISLVISLTTTPMLCATLLRRDAHLRKPGLVARLFERGYAALERTFARSLDWALVSKPLVVLILLVAMGLSWWLYTVVPKGFFPRQDSSQLMAGIRADQSISFQAMSEKLRTVIDIIRKDQSVRTVVGFTGGGRAGGGFMFVDLKPLAERGESGQAVIARLRPQLSQVPGISIFLNPVQDLRMGGRMSSSTYQYTLEGDDAGELRTWATRLAEELKGSTLLTDIDTDQEDNGAETMVTVDRDSAARMGISARDVNNALYNAFGQRQVATIYDDINQYSIVMEWAPPFVQGPEALADVQVPVRIAGAAARAAGNVIDPGARDQASGQALSTSDRAMVPLPVIASFSQRATATSVNHQNLSLATTISFNLPDGVALSQAQAEIRAAEARIAMPTSVRGSFQGTARNFDATQNQQPILIAAAIIAIYLVLGVLYESTIHPITVLSTLPAAGVGAVMALMAFGLDFSLIALIGVFLLLGIVKKNAILIIDFAIEAQRTRGLSATDAVREASLKRFRPILMTTLAAGLGALPLAIGFGEGFELRQPLGIAIIGGLIASQVLTLITTPVVYVYMDRLRRRPRASGGQAHPSPAE
ncbi:efflux RND transporter permease subunit [Zavarzinia sp. CC-PAN008]|uniref:efflux RND transporter permease subunit n=1 Tax=Zavarzinia sp. CC-PAN008 TaxID=3243332 RepID=UPI003F74A979